MQLGPSCCNDVSDLDQGLAVYVVRFFEISFQMRYLGARIIYKTGADASWYHLTA